MQNISSLLLLGFVSIQLLNGRAHAQTIPNQAATEMTDSPTPPPTKAKETSKELSIQEILEKKELERKSQLSQDSTKEPTKEPSADFDFLKSLDYPELQVVPRASERLVLEAREERESGWRANWQYWLSGLTTLTLSTMAKSQYRADLSEQDKLNANQVVLAGQVIGAGWLGVGLWMSFYSPYQDGITKLQTLPKPKDKRTELLRERLAEEAMEKPASWVQKARWLSTLTQLAANAAIYYYLKSDGQMYAAGGVLASFIPVFFEHRYITTFERHQLYKKQIYTPLARTFVVPQPQSSPLLVTQLTWSF